MRKPVVVVGVDGSRAEAQGDGEVKGKGKGRLKSKGKGKGKDEDRRKGEFDEEVVKMDAGMVEAMMHAVMKVERNFWVFVADELERDAGKYIDPRELEKIFHEV